MTTWLLDTGPLVAYLDQDDPAHAEVAECWDRFRGRLVTTSAVVTEAMRLMARSAKGPRYLAELASASGLVVHDLSAPADLHDAADLIERYADTPMDFVDATLLLLAEVLGVDTVFSLDRKGFGAYRTREGNALRLAQDVDPAAP